MFLKNRTFPNTIKRRPISNFSLLVTVQFSRFEVFRNGKHFSILRIFVFSKIIHKSPSDRLMYFSDD